MKYDYLPGEVYEREHPFTLVRENRGDPDTEFERWRPGAWETIMLSDDTIQACHALGKVSFTVVSIHKPPGYPTRIFFKRQFTCPDGTPYLPGRLMNCVTSKFARDVRKFPFDYEITEL